MVNLIVSNEVTPAILFAEIIFVFLLHRYIEPLPEGSEKKFEFENMMVGQAVPSQFIAAIEKGFIEASNS